MNIIREIKIRAHVACENYDMKNILPRIALRLMSLFGEKPRALADFWRLQYLCEREPESINMDRIIEMFALDVKRTAVDVGASYGFWTSALSRRFSAVIAIEPNPRLAGFIISRRLRATVIQAAVSNVSKTVQLWIPHDRTGALVGWSSLDPENYKFAIFKESINVQARLLNDILKDCSPSFIKMDVEGHEYEALLGASKIICASKPLILCEIKPHNLDKVRILMESLNYSLIKSQDVLNVPTSDEMFFIIPTDHPQLRHIMWKVGLSDSG